MSILDQLTQQAGRLAGDVQQSLKRARLQGERRLLERQHRGSLEELGERTFTMVKEGTLDEGALSAQIAAVESAWLEIEAKDAEIAALNEASADDTPPVATGAADGDAPEGGAGPGWDAAARFFASDDKQS